MDRARARKERAQALARQDILDAALRAFARRGYADTKMSDIAAEAGFTAASLYTYFPGKRELFDAAAAHFVEAVKTAYGEAPSRPVESIEELESEVRTRIRSLCAFGDAQHEVLGFFMRLRWTGEAQDEPEEGVGATGRSDARQARTETSVDAHFAGIWGALGVERFGLQPSVIVGVIGACIEAFFARRYLFGQGGTLAEDADEIANLLLFGMTGRRRQG
jgi:AcrR family transcriptional regulator